MDVWRRQLQCTHTILKVEEKGPVASAKLWLFLLLLLVQYFLSGLTIFPFFSLCIQTSSAIRIRQHVSGRRHECRTEIEPRRLLCAARKMYEEEARAKSKLLGLAFSSCLNFRRLCFFRRSPPPRIQFGELGKQHFGCTTASRRREEKVSCFPRA